MRLIYGVGINDADYVVKKWENYKDDSGKRRQKLLWSCPFYEKWKHMLERCYSQKCHSRQPAYVGCYVCEEWLTFSKFKRWMEEQNWEGNDLDKDLLVKGNKIYSPETCIFVSHVVNTFMLSSKGRKGSNTPVGVSWKKKDKLYVAMCNNPISGANEYLGSFKDSESAHLAWKKRKQELAIDLANLQEDNRVKEILLREF